MQLCSKPRGARGIEPETFRRRGQLLSCPPTTGHKMCCPPYITGQDPGSSANLMHVTCMAQLHLATQYVPGLVQCTSYHSRTIWSGAPASRTCDGGPPPSLCAHRCARGTFVIINTLAAAALFCRMYVNVYVNVKVRVKVHVNVNEHVNEHVNVNVIEDVNVSTCVRLSHLWFRMFTYCHPLLLLALYSESAAMGTIVMLHGEGRICLAKSNGRNQNDEQPSKRKPQEAVHTCRNQTKLQHDTPS